MSGNKIKRDLPNNEYQAAVGANSPSASNVFATIADLTSADIPHAVASGTNTYTVTVPGVTAYTDGDAYLIRFTNGSDADSTININGLGAKTLVKEFAQQLTGGDIIAGQELVLIYDGTNFQCIGVQPNQLFAYVTNDDSVAILKGQPVYAFGAAGNRMSVKLASNLADATSAQTVGVVFSSSIAPNQRGFIITQGVISGVNTAAYSAGNQLYLGVAAGSLTNVKPYAPNHLVYIGIVERANAGNGQIYVKPQNGYELDELHDVDLITTPPTDGQVLTYDSITGLWKNENIYYQTIQDEGISLPQRPTINITGDGVTASDDALNNKTVINVPGAYGITTYYFNETVTQAPYKEFSSNPTAAAEQTLATVVTPLTTVTIQSFQTPSGIPNTTNIPGGRWAFYLHFSGTLGNAWSVFAEVYKRDLGGIETLLLTTDVIPTTSLSGTPTMILTDGILPPTTTLTTDRIVVKVKATNDDPVNTHTITFHTEGSTNYSIGTTTLNQSVPTGAVTSVTGTAPITSSGGTTPAIGIPQATALVDGYLDNADWSTFNGKQDPITLTTTGSSGASTFIANTLNIPNYTISGLGGVPISRTITINGTTFDLSANRTWNVGTVTSVSLSAGTGISVGGTNPVTSSGTITVTNTAPDQTVVLNAGTGIGVTGTYPNFTISNTDPTSGVTLTSAGGTETLVNDGTGPSLATKGITAGTGISLSSTATDLTVTNSAPDQIVALTAGTGINVTGSYPNFTIDNTNPATITGSGIADYIARWTPTGTQLGTGAIRDDGSYVGIGTAPGSGPTGYKLYVKATSTVAVGILGELASSVTSASTKTAVNGLNKATGSGTNIGVYGYTAFGSGTNIGVEATAQSLEATATNIGIWANASFGLSRYAAKFTDGTEGIGKFLKSVTADGKTNWADLTVADTGLALTTTGTTGAATLIADTLNIPQYQGQLTLTTTGTSGAATLIGDTLNIPQYSGVNIYNSDGTFTGNRTVDANGFSLTVNNLTTLEENLTPGISTVGKTININTAGMSGAVGTRIYKIVDSNAGVERFGITRNGNVRFNNTYTFPIIDGTAGQVLTTSGGGVVSWQTPTVSPTTKTVQLGITEVFGGTTYALNGNVLLYNNSGSGGGVLNSNRWQFVVPADFSSAGSLILKTYRTTTAAATSLTIYINGVASNINGVAFSPSALSTYQTFTNNITSALVPGDTVTVLAQTTLTSGENFYFRDIYFNYL